MYDDSMNREAADSLAELDRRIVQALENVPEIEIPAGFAARVAGKVPARPVVSLRSTYYGRGAMIACTVVLLVVLVMLAGHRADVSTLALTIQWTVFAQFIGLVVWLSMRWRRVD